MSASSGAGGVNNHTWGEVVNALILDAADESKLKNISELTGVERNTLLEALKSGKTSTITDQELNILYEKLTKTAHFEKPNNLRARISRAIQNMVGMRMSSVKFSEEVRKFEQIVQPLSKDSINLITKHLKDNLKADTGQIVPGAGNRITRTLEWEYTPQGMQAKLPTKEHELHSVYGPLPKRSQKIESEGSCSVVVSKYEALRNKCKEQLHGETIQGKELSQTTWFNEWAKTNDRKTVLKNVTIFLKDQFKKICGECDVREEGGARLFTFPGKNREEIQKYLEIRFPDFDGFELTENEGTPVLKIENDYLILFNEFQRKVRNTGG